MRLIARGWRWLVERVEHVLLHWRIRRGKQLWGRQPPPGTVATMMKGTLTISAVVTRADGRVEPLGTISRSKR